MRIKDKVTIAFRNLSAGSRMVRKMIFCMTFVMMILFCSLTIIQSYHVYSEEFNQKHAADCYYYTELGNQVITDDTINDLLTQSRTVQERYHASEVSVLCTIQPRSMDMQLEVGNTNLALGDETYQAVNYFLYQRKLYQDIRWESSPFVCALYKKEMSVFTDKITAEYGEGYLLGNYPENPGEIMLDTYLLEVYGVKDIDEYLLGTTVSVCCTEEGTEEIVLKDYILTGIFQSNLLSYRESKLTADSHLEHVYVNLRTEDEARFMISSGSVRYYFENYAEYVLNYDNTNNILQLNVSEVYESDDTEMKLTGMGMEYCLLYWIMDHIGKLLLLVAAVIGLIITFSVFYVFQFYRNRNKRYLSMLLNIGMEKKDRRWIFSVEMFAVILAATVLGIYLSAVFLLLFNAVTRQVLNFNVTFDGKTGITAVFACWLYFGLCLRIAMRKE